MEQSEITKRRKPVAREIIMARAAKSSATKLAKRITKTCLKCGKDWKEKPSHSQRKYCSSECAGNKIKNPCSERSCVQCGSMFISTWKTRKKITCSPNCARLRQAETMKELGHTPIKCRDKVKWLAAIQSESHRMAMSKINTGKVRTTPKTKRHSPQHFRAVECFLRDSFNVVHHVRNINRFVHNNPHLFPSETLNWHPTKRSNSTLCCNAAMGLASVASGRRMTWRGWQVVSNREGRERFDLIGRNRIELATPATPAPPAQSGPS
jgi:hypothetical protein